jgi:colicin import membrane protein
VLKAELNKSSGNRAYDSAVERAILKSDPLPIPPDATLFNRFRELDLVFKPKE